MTRRLDRNIDSEFRRDLIHRGRDQIIPESNFSADYAIPQVHMMINFASETYHHIAFVIASDSSTCTIYSDDINADNVNRVYTMLMKTTLQHVFLDASADVPPQPEKLNMLMRRRRPSERTVYGLLYFYHQHHPVVVARAQAAHFPQQY